LCSGGDDRGNVIGRAGAGEADVLSVVAAEPAGFGGLFCGFDAFDHDRDPERVGRAGDRGDDWCVVAACEGWDEGSVDLQLVDLESCEVAQRGVAGAEVVESHSYLVSGAELSQLGGDLGVLDQRAFGELELEVNRTVGSARSRRRR
jgi:hypothetical protein